MYRDVSTVLEQCIADNGLYSIVICVAYYLLWIYAIPYWRGYRIRQTTLQLQDGANTHTLIKVPRDQIEEWDRTHDPSGKPIDDDVNQGSNDSTIREWKGPEVADGELKP